MSGVCGIVRFDFKSIKKQDINNMLGSMPEDNYDNESLWYEKNVGLAHRLLWTTPESIHENQPLVSNDGMLVLTADARIDNRESLIEQLSVDEKEFDVITDADLILWSYMKWGDRCPQYLLGDFAFAIWDKKEQTIFAVRDRFSIKPFYFCFFDQRLYFSSYINVLLNCVPLTHSVNQGAIKSFGKFATINYEHTMYETIFRIPPAHAFVFSQDGLIKKRYWFPENIKRNQHITLDEAKNKVKTLLNDAVKSCLRVHGNWGCELSGGLDSTAIALIAKQFTEERIDTFSMRYRSYTCDEWEYTIDAINSLNSRSTSVDVDRLDFRAKYNMNSLLQYSCNWPVYGSFVQNYALGEAMAAHNIRVCLTGHGGDHVFTGSYAWIEYIKNLQFSILFKELSCSDNAYSKLLNIIIRSLMPDTVKKFIKSFRSQKSNFDVVRPEDFIDYWKLPNQKNVIYSDLYTLVGRQHVMHTDNNHYRALEMNYKIEFRHPFFDTRLVEFILSLPNQYKYSCGTIKIILREALKDLYPDKIYSRDNKAEFSEALLAQMEPLDIEKLWKKSTLIKRKLVDENLLSELITQYQHQNIDAEGIGNLWRLTTLAIWFNYLDKTD